MIELTIIAIAQLAVIVVLLIERRRPQHTDMIALVDRLCQRVQAPTVAVAEHAAAIGGDWALPAVPMDDDQAHWESKESLAQRLAAAEVNHG